MNNREYFHESVVRDVVDILTSLKDYDEVEFLANSNNRRSFKSITSATKDLILTFPVLVSSDLDPDNACMVAKAHEKKCASLMHMLFTAICVGSNEDVYDYVRKFHNNLGSMGGTLDSYADSLDRIAAAVDENYEVKLKIDRDVLNVVLQELKESNYVLPDNIKENSIESFKIIPSSLTGSRDRIVQEANGSPQHKHYHNDETHTHFDTVKSTQTNKLFSDITSNSNNRQDNSVRTTNITNYNGTSQGEISAKAKEANYKSLELQYKVHNTAFLNAEYKKANELMPTMMVVNFICKGQDGAPDTCTTAVIGIKAKVYPVSAMDICNRISSKASDQNVLTNFVRATTNEIGFFRDFLFAVDKAKIDAKSYGRQASSNKLWKVLERRSVKSKFRRSLKMYNDATAITLLTISSNDVDYMKKNHNLDITNAATARKILDAYNFMGICILDEAIETASFLYDTGDDNYERLTFSNLEREASDSSYKKIVNLLTKMNR